jgi:hypothetical protein
LVSILIEIGRMIGTAYRKSFIKDDVWEATESAIEVQSGGSLGPSLTLPISQGSEGCTIDNKAQTEQREYHAVHL